MGLSKKVLRFFSERSYFMLGISSERFQYIKQIKTEFCVNFSMKEDEYNDEFITRMYYALKLHEHKGHIKTWKKFLREEKAAMEATVESMLEYENGLRGENLK